MELLKYWLIFIALLSTYSTFIGYFHPAQLREQQFSDAPEKFTDLAASLFASWTFLSTVVRLNCALNIHEKGIYRSCIFTFIIALFLYSREFFLFKTIPLQKALPIFIVTPISILWMTIQYGYYIGNKKGKKN